MAYLQRAELETSSVTRGAEVLGCKACSQGGLMIYLDNLAHFPRAVQ